MPRSEDLEHLFPDLDLADALQQRPVGIGSLSNVLRIAVAVTVSYVVTAQFVPGANALFAPITSLIVVQATPWRTAGVTLQRVVGAAIGVLLSSLWVNLVGLTWWSMLIAVTAALLVARQFKWSIGGQLQIPLAVVFVMALGPGSQGHDLWRVLDVVIGGAVGLLFTLVLPSRPSPAKLEQALRDFRQAIYDMFAAMAQECGTLASPLPADQDHAFVAASRRMHNLSATARTQLVRLVEGTQWNFRGRNIATRLDSDAWRLQRLAGFAIQARALGGAANRLYDRADLSPHLPPVQFAELVHQLIGLMQVALGAGSEPVGDGDPGAIGRLSSALESALLSHTNAIANSGPASTESLASISLLGRMDHLRWQLVDYPRGV